MYTYLSPEWHEAAVKLAATLPKRPGATATLAFKITASPRGDFTYVQELVDGRIVRQELAKTDGADIVFTVTWADSVAVMRGELDANVAVMQGRIKADGNIGALMAILPVTASAEYRSIQQQVQAITEAG
jgi:putative sterol carrier protein